MRCGGFAAERREGSRYRSAAAGAQPVADLGGGAAAPPFGVLQKNSGSTNFEIVSTADSAIIIIINFYIAASSHEIFLRVGGREGMKVLGALQRHQLPHPLAKILDPPLCPAAATPQHGP